MATHRNGLLVALVGLLLLASAVARAGPPPARPPSVVRGLQWIRRQQNPKTGLFTSYDMPGDTTAWTYDQALAIKALLAGGGQSDVLAAVGCAAAMLSIRDSGHHVWSDAYSAVGLKRKVQVEVDRKDSYIRWRWRAAGDVRARPRGVGPNAWMGLALLDLYGRSVEGPGLAEGGRPSPTDYLSAAEQIADFIISLQLRKGVSLPDGSVPRDPRTEGAIVGGYDEEGRLFTWVSTEHCVDSIAFLASLAKATAKPKYRAAAVLTARWLRREMWDEEARCYLPGYENALDGTASTYRERLDGQTWSALVLHAAAQDPGWPEGDDLRAENGLPWIDRFLCTGVVYGKSRLVGFPKVTGELPAKPAGERHPVPPSPWPGVWAEGTAGAILAARRTGRAPGEVSEMVRSLRDLQHGRGGVLYSVGESHKDVRDWFSAQDLPVATFEAHPNCLFANVGVYGKGEPDWEAIKKTRDAKPPRGEDRPRVPPFSWYYEPSTPGYQKNVGVHSGLQAFRLVNGGPGCLEKKDAKGDPVTWSSLGLDLGPRVDAEGNASDDPEAAIRPLDASAYWGFQFWARTEDSRGARLAVGFRDASAKTAEPQAVQMPIDVESRQSRPVTREWRRYVVPLGLLGGKVDRRALVHVNMEFGDRFCLGEQPGNRPGTIIYVDDVAFVSSPNKGPGKGRMPEVYPQHWPFGSMAGTAWLIFVELDVNPFHCPVPGPDGAATR